MKNSFTYYKLMSDIQRNNNKLLTNSTADEMKIS